MSLIAEDKPFHLRREVGFYSFLAIVLLAITVFVVAVSLIKGVQLPWVGLGIAICFLGLAGAISYSYCIEWDGNRIVQRAFLSKKVEMTADEIHSIEKEISAFAEAAQMRRPFRRIVLYGKGDSGRVDISLGGFNRGDIKKLLALIALRRPDLGMPKV